MNRPSNQLQKRNRVMSAKAPSSRSRPLSGYTSRQFQKTQVFENIYNGTRDQSPSRKTGQKSIVYQGINTEELAKYKRTSTFVTSKDREQLFEQNMKLKRQNNKLNDQLQIMKGKFEARGRKVKDRNKQLDIEFQKPLYWSGNKTHLISGIKFQYDKLCKDHANLQKQLQDTKIALFQSKAPEILIYSEEVGRQNERLKAKLQNLIKSQCEIPNESNKQIMSYMYSESEAKKHDLEKKLAQVRIQLGTVTQEVKDKQKKLAFLQKLLIEKDNRGYHLHRKNQRLEKQLSSRLTEIQNLNQSILCIESNNKSQLQRVQLNLKQQHESEIKLYNQDLQKKNKIIRGLEQDNKNMETLINKLRMNNTGSFMMANNKSMIEMGKDKARDTFVYSENIEKDESQIGIPSKNYASALSNYQSEVKQEEEKEVKKQRVRQTADKKHSENAKKCRRVDHKQVKDVGQLLKYRMIGYEISGKQLKQFFSFHNEEDLPIIKDIEKKIQENQKQEVDQSQEAQQIRWKQEYITMKETQSILQNAPFGLNAESAHLLSRYIIEDSVEEHVYCDQNNEHKRQVVKSIIKSLIGDYQLMRPDQQEKLQDFMLKYSSNFQLSLQSYYPNGYVTIRKFLDILKSLGYDNASQISDILVGKIIKNSTDLQRLYYPQLFEGGQGEQQGKKEEEANEAKE